MSFELVRMRLKRGPIEKGEEKGKENSEFEKRDWAETKDSQLHHHMPYELEALQCPIGMGWIHVLPPPLLHIFFKYFK